jgi:hypothetical protein
MSSGFSNGDSIRRADEFVSRLEAQVVGGMMNRGTNRQVPGFTVIFIHLGDGKFEYKINGVIVRRVDAVNLYAGRGYNGAGQ